MKYDVVIIGGGPAGISAALWCKRLGVNHVLIEKNEIGGQLADIHNQIIDYPGFIGRGWELKQRFLDHITESGCDILKGTITEINAMENTVSLAENQLRISYTYLIVAAGASPRSLGVKGEKEMIARGEVYSASKDSPLFIQKRVAIIGGGNRALEGALILSNQQTEVFLIHRSSQFRARREYIEPVKNHPDIHVYTDCIVKEISGSDKVESIVIEDDRKQLQSFPVDAVLVRIGIKPNSEMYHFLELDDEGFIVTDSYGKTSVDNIYAIGDIATKPTFSSISSSVGQGMVAAKHISLLLE